MHAEEDEAAGDPLLLVVMRVLLEEDLQHIITSCDCKAQQEATLKKVKSSFPECVSNAAIGCC